MKERVEPLDTKLNLTEKENELLKKEELLKAGGGKGLVAKPAAEKGAFAKDAMHTGGNYLRRPALLSRVVRRAEANPSEVRKCLPLSVDCSHTTAGMVVVAEGAAKSCMHGTAASVNGAGRHGIKVTTGTGAGVVDAAGA